MDNNQFQPQENPNINYQPGYTFAQPPRKKRNLIWLWIMVGLIGAAGIAAVLAFTVFVPAPVAAPHNELMLCGSEVIMARGGEAVSLGKASYTIDTPTVYRLNSFTTANGGTLFYLCDIDKDTGEGTLMRVERAGSRPPVKVAQNVCMARVSGDGSRVLCVTDMDRTGGDLMLIEKGQTKRVAENVVPGDIVFSRNGRYFSFLQANKAAGGYEFTVYAGRSAEDIEEVDDFITDSYNHYLFFSDILDNGTLVYMIWAYKGLDKESRLCACEYGGKPDKLDDDGFPAWTDGSAYLYADEDYTLYYADGTKEKRMISDFEYYEGVWDENGRVMDDRLLLYQKSSSDGAYNVYALTFGQDEEKICEADRYSVTAGHGLNYVSYTLDGELFISVKGEDGWKETSMDTKPLGQAFEDSGRYFYFIAAKNETETKGDLYRYDMKTGKKKKLKTDVVSLRLAGDAVYTIDEDRKAYYIAPDGEETRVAANALELFAGGGGVYIKQEDGKAFSLLYARPDGGAEEVAGGFDRLLGIGWSIEYQAPLPSDAKQALNEMREDALIALDICNDTHLAETDTPHREYGESRTLADELRNRPDVSNEVQNILLDFYLGFSDIEYAGKYTDEGDYAKAEEYYNEMQQHLSDAVSAYGAYLAK